MSKIIVKWSGKYPIYCLGEWTLIIDGVDCTECIPEDLRKIDMHTYGVYEGWYLSDNGLFYIWEKHQNGFICNEWIDNNHYWLKNLPIEESEYPDVYKAFNENDFRMRQCSRCI